MKFIAPLVLAVAVKGFAPTARPATSTMALSMGLFDFLQPKPPAPKGDNAPKGGGGGGFLNGRGARITIRDDEDNAMWVETPDGKRKSANGK